MLLERTLEKNPAMIEAGVKLHQAGQIPTGSWLFDLDAVAHNARALTAEARRLDLQTYVMTKQIGRNPFVTALALHCGLNKAVAVDIQCARLLHRYRLPVGHIGHLNQMPTRDLAEALEFRPDVITVYSVEAARRISDAAGAIGRSQDLLLQVYRPGDVYFPGQEGGIRFEELLPAAREILSFPNVRIAGVTSFPVLSYDFTGKQETAFNPNMRTVIESAELLRNELGVEITQINAPGNTSLATLAMLREGGGTHVEPGHGLTGTTPAHHIDPELAEIPAYTFVTEVSHHYEGKAYGIAAGGLWALMGGFLDPAWRIGGLVGSDPKAALSNRLDYEHLDQIIDYHIPLVPGDRAKIGDSVIFPIYSQMHMTRSYVVPVSGVSTGDLRVWGVFDNATTMLDRNWNPIAPNEVIHLIDELLELYPN
jgi:predicted amino acid racemase